MGSKFFINFWNRTILLSMLCICLGFSSEQSIKDGANMRKNYIICIFSELMALAVKIIIKLFNVLTETLKYVQS
jgi:hypothetical protein